MSDMLASDHFAPDLADTPYFSVAWYDRLHAIVGYWLELREIPDDLRANPVDRTAAEQLLSTEARFLDQERLEEWLTLYGRRGLLDPVGCRGARSAHNRIMGVERPAPTRRES